MKEFSCHARNDKSNQLETENTFTEQSIDKTQNDLTKNNTTKSVILAPFNSTISDESISNVEIKEIMRDKKTIKLSSNVRDIDKQYEKNNNCEVDNGVYNKNACNEDLDLDDNNLDPFNNLTTPKEKIISPKLSHKSSHFENYSLNFLNDIPYINIEETEKSNISNLTKTWILLRKWKNLELRRKFY